MSLRSKNPTRLRCGMGLIVATLSLGISSVTVNAATLTPQLSLDGDILEENNFVFSTNLIDFEGVVAQNLATSSSELGSLDDLLMAFNTPEQSMSTKASLDWKKVFNSFSQLRFSVPKLGGKGGELAILAQVDADNIMQGLYDFSPTKETSQESNSLSLAANSLLNFGNNNDSNLSWATVGMRSGTVAGGEGGLVARESIRAEYTKLWQNNTDARWDLIPTNVSRTEVTTMKGGSASHISQMDKHLTTKVGTSFSLMPKNNLPTAMNLKDDYLKTSPMLNRDFANARLQVTQDVRSSLRNAAQKESQRLVELQQKGQNKQPLQPRRPRY